MAEGNVFDSLDGEAAALAEVEQPAGVSVFDQFDSLQPPQPAASQPAAQPAPAPTMPGVSVVGDDEVRTGDRGIQDLLDNFKVANARDGTDKLNESRGRDFVQKVGTFLQYEAELIKGVPSGAVSGVGTALSGAGAVKAGAEANIATFANQQIAVMDRIDAGEFKAADQLHPSLAGYGQMSAAQRELARERVRRQFYGFTPTPVQQQGLSKAGAALKEHAKTILPAAPGYEEVWTRQIGEGLGSMAVGLPVALVGGAGAGGLLYGAMGAGEAAERAIEYDRKEKAAGRAGLTQDDIIRSAIWGVGPGATDVLPVEMLLGRLRVPPALAKLGAKTIGRIGGQAFLRMAQQAVVEGSQEGAQQFLQNMIESRYDAGQPLGEGVLPSAGVGAGVGGVAQAGKEMAQLALRRFAGRRGPGADVSRPAPAGAPQPAAPGPTQPPAAAPQAAGSATPAASPAAAPAPQGAESQPTTPIDRAPLRQQFDQFLAMEDELAAIPDDTEAPEPLRNNLIAAEDQLIAQFQASGLPGDSLADGVRPIESFDDIKRAFDEATPEEIDDYWQGGQTIGAAAAGAAVRTGEAPSGGASAQAGGVQFKTAKGSAYSVHEDGTTTRDKAFRPEHGAKEQGLQPRSEATFYVTPEEAIKLGEFQTTGSKKSIERTSGGQYAVKYLDGPSAGKFEKRTVVSPKAQPEAGLIPVEIWKGGQRVHFGNEITEVSRPGEVGPEFLRLIATGAPRSEWAASLGVTEQALAPHIDRAIEKGLLRRDRNGVIRRNARELEGFEPEEEIVTQKLEQAEESGHAALVAPGAIDGDNVAMTPAGLDKIAELQKVVAQALAKILPREVRLEVVDNIKIGRLAREDELFGLRDFLGLPSKTPFQKWFGNSKAVDADGKPLVVYHGTQASFEAFDAERAGNEGIFFSLDLRTSNHYAERGGAGANLIPAYVRIEHPAPTYRAFLDDAKYDGYFSYPTYVVRRPEQVKSIFNRGTFDLKDPRLSYSLRSSKSAKLAEGTDEGVESDELQGDGGEAGQASNDASRSSDAGAIAAAVGGGGASGAATAEGRILRQESATLRSDGSVFAGRIAGTKRPADAGARDGRKSQGFGQTEQFTAPAGYTGYVTADAPFSHARLDRANAPKSQYRLATLTYRIYHKGTKLPDPKADPKTQIGSGLIHARVSQHMDGTWEVQWVQRLADPDVFPKNMSDLLYASIEKDLGIRLSPSGLLSGAGLKMWRRRSPESVKWHKWSKSEGYFISPRRIKDNISKIGMDLADIAARPDSDPDKAEDHAIAMAERKELIKLWTKLPVEARAATPNMFSLGHGQYAIGQTDPAAKLISIAVRGVEAEARRTGKSEAKIAVEAGRHEALEFFLAHGFISPKEWGALTAAARAENWIDETGIRKPYTDHYGEAVDSDRLEDIILKEAIAEKYGRYERGDYSPKGLIAQVFKRLKNLLDRIRNGIAGNGFQRWEDIFQKMDEGEMRRRYEARFGAPAAERKSRVTSKAVPAEGRIAAMTLPGMAQNAPLSPDPAGPTPGLAASAPGSLIDIQRALRQRLGLTVASGRLDPAASRAAAASGSKMMGQFDRQTEVIRLRTLQDIDTEAHEVAHALENRYPGIAGLQQAHSAELNGVASLTGQTGLSEGFAEFFRLYLTNPQAIDSHAPAFRAAFEDFLETEDARALQDIQDIQAQYQEWRNASSAGRVVAAVKSGAPEKTWEKIRSEYDRGGLTRVGGMFWAYMESIYKSRIDKTDPIRVLVGRIAQAAEANNQDIDLSAWRNPQMQAAKISASDGMSYADVTRGVSWANAAGRGSISLRDALATAFGGTAYEHWTPEQRDAFGAYLIARRGRWLWQRFEMDPARNLGRTATAPANPSNGDWYFDTMRRVRRVYLRGRWESELIRAPDKHTRADHEQAILDLEAANPQFSIAAQMVYQFNRDLALKRFQAGLDSQEEYDYKNGATDYVPWFRDMSDAIFAGTGASGRKVQQKFKLRGSYRDFINPVEGIIRQVYDTNREIAVNRPKLLLAQLADSVQGAGQYAEIIPATRMAVEEVKVRDALEAAGRAEGLPPEDVKDMISAVAAMIGDDAVAKLFRSEQAGDGRDAVLHYMDAGVLKMLQIHDDERGIARDIIGFFETLNATPAADAFAGMLQAAVRIPQRAITASVGFMWRNMIRDAMQAKILQAGYWPAVSNIRTIASNRARANRGEETWGEILVRHGGIMGGFNRTDIQQAKAGRVLDLRSDAVTLRPWERQFWKQTVNPWHEDFWKWAEATEANTRQTIARISHKRALADAKMRYPAMHPDQQEFIALEAATQKSRDYMDYSRMGDATSQMVFNRYLMFLNPYIQGMDKGLRAVFLAQTNEGRFAAAQVIRKKIAPLFNDDLQYQRLTKSEKDALKDAARIWLSISMIAVTHLLIEVNFNDPDDLEDRSNMERATSVSFTINGVHYRIPRGFDVLNLVSNGLRAVYESWWREDPTARERFLLSQAATQLPPLSNPMLDLFIGWKFSKNNFFNSDIEQRHMAGLLPEDRYSAYTSGLSRRIGEAVEMSPAMVEYTMTSVGADWARDLLRAYDVIDPSKPALKWQDYPFLRAARGLRSSHGAEEFWDLMGQDGEFLQVAGSYKDHAVDKRDWSRDDMRRFFDRRLKDDDARAFAVLHGHYDIEQRRLHPMIRAQEFAKGLSSTMRDVASNRVDVPTFGKNEKRVEISREIRGQAMDIMAEINRREYRNALIALKRPGYENREPQPVKPYLEELKAISPEIHKTLMGKLTTSKGPNVYDYDRVRESWPDTRAKLLSRDKKETIIERQGDIEFNDLKARVQGAKALGVH
jgi:hypothetical protein